MCNYIVFETQYVELTLKVVVFEKFSRVLIIVLTNAMEQVLRKLIVP
jgi:hypothetical protein